MIGGCIQGIAMAALLSSAGALESAEDAVLLKAAALRTDERATVVKKYWDDFDEMPPAELINQHRGYHADVFNTLNLEVFQQIDDCFQSGNVSREHVAIQIRDGGYYNFYFIWDLERPDSGDTSTFTSCVEKYGFIYHTSRILWSHASYTSTRNMNMTHTISGLNDNGTVAMLWSREAFAELFHGELQAPLVGEVLETDIPWDDQTDWESDEEHERTGEDTAGREMMEQSTQELETAIVATVEAQPTRTMVQAYQPSISHSINDTLLMAPRSALPPMQHARIVRGFSI